MVAPFTARQRFVDAERPNSRDDLPEKVAQKRGVESAQEDVPIGGASGKGIPQDHAHAPLLSLFLLLFGHHPQNGAASVPSLLYLASGHKNYLPDRVVLL